MAALSRRGFVGRAVALAGMSFGRSIFGGMAVRVWALPSPSLPHTYRDQSAVRLSPLAAKTREADASRIRDFQVLLGHLEESSFSKADVVAMDGVKEFASEGSKAVAISLKPAGDDFREAILATRWGSDGGASVESFMWHPDPTGKASFMTRSFVKGDALATERLPEPGLECDSGCHPHPPGPCPDECIVDACLHCHAATKLCYGCAVDEAFFQKCAVGCLLLPKPWNAVCVGACYSAAEHDCQFYCCEYIDYLQCFQK